MEKFANKEIKTSYKLQRVDQIPKYYKGKIRNLLEKIDERRILNELLKSLKIEDLMDKNINELSGGELQRVAIVACLSKDADIYYIDEPTSFLDVFQRLAVAKVIRTCSVNKSTIVADHDLATLDFLADKIHIFYGVPTVYGIVSKPYGVRVGINTFLDGFIKEDNIRIRSEPIKFFTSVIDKKVSQNILVSFKNLKKSFDGFTLDIEGGDLRKQEALAVFGANALGKTTFAKILAGEMEAKGEIDKKVEISYKPQYLTAEKKTVREVLSKITNIESDSYKAEIIRPLELTKLLDKNINELSGGELQRVAIAACLSTEVEIYLLDEPSAFLDVEQRLALAKLLNRIVEVKEKSALVIDHDLLFLSQIGSRAMVFLGECGIRGYVKEISNLSDAFNEFLKQVGVTFRKDPQTGRPRANKLDSQLDREQKEKNKYFYV
jgi:ATP-binding cassette subfamily E protein 1